MGSVGKRDLAVVALPYGSHMGVCEILTFS